MRSGFFTRSPFFVIPGIERLKKKGFQHHDYLMISKDFFKFSRLPFYNRSRIHDSDSIRLYPWPNRRTFPVHSPQITQREPNSVICPNDMGDIPQIWFGLYPLITGMYTQCYKRRALAINMPMSLGRGPFLA